MNALLTHIVKYRDSLPWHVRKQLKRSRCWVVWVQGTCITWGRLWPRAFKDVWPIESIAKQDLGVGKNGELCKDRWTDRNDLYVVW